MEDRTFLTVEDPTSVVVVTPTLGADAKRKLFARASAGIPKHRFGTYMPLVEMSIYLRTCFVRSEARDEVVRFIGAVVEESEVATDDDGVTQKTTVRKGISMREGKDVPGLVSLQPYRTFHDVDQPGSPFVLRLDNFGKGVEAALFEADGGAWKHEAMENVATFLRAELDDGIQVYA